MEYTLIGGPLFGDEGQYLAEMTIKKLLKDGKNSWSLEIPGFTEEHLCNPYYDDGDFNGFDEIPTIEPDKSQVGLFDECYPAWGVLVVAYDGETDDVLRWHKWIKNNRSVTFVFRKREKGVVKKMWVFYDVKPFDIEYDSIEGLEDIALEFHFGRFENRDLQSPALKYNDDGLDPSQSWY